METGYIWIVLDDKGRPLYGFLNDYEAEDFCRLQGIHFRNIWKTPFQ